ncbi:MAG: YraN family protein [Pseudomonadota bacterium]
MQLEFDFTDALPVAAPRAPIVQSDPPLRRSPIRHSGQRYFAGLAAEEAVERQYQRQGATCLERRYRCQHGEIDLIFLEGDNVVFVEVKRRKTPIGFDDPVPATQWRRLGNAALQFLADYASVNGRYPYCRFDVAVATRDGLIQVFKNARAFDA